MKNRSGNIGIHKIEWQLAMEIGVIICLLFGRHGYPNLGGGLIINNKKTIYLLSMPIMDFYEFERRAREYREEKMLTVIEV